jgi:predicted dehydrogenase
MSFQPVKLGVVGVGGFGLLHAKTLMGLAETQLVAVVDRRPDRLALVSPTPGWTDLNAALTESEAEAWVVASSTASHVAVTKAILYAGKPVLLEKPVATSLAEAKTLRPLVRRESSNLMMGHILLFNSELAQLRAEVARRGPIRFFNSVRHRPATTLDSYPGESPLRLLMVHDLYLAVAFLGSAEPDYFSCQLGRSPRGINLVNAQLSWDDQTLASFAASYLTPPGMANDGFDRLEVFGDDWMARVEPNPRPIQLWHESAAWPMTLEIRAGDGQPTGMLAEELRAFCRVVRGLEPVPAGATYDDALQVLDWIEILESTTDEPND